MIHWTKEGQQLETGLNVYVSFTRKFWFRLVWVSVDLPQKEASYNYFRFRVYLKPYFIFEKTKYNIIDAYLLSKDLKIITKQSYESYEVPEATKEERLRYAF